MLDRLPHDLRDALAELPNTEQNALARVWVLAETATPTAPPFAPPPVEDLLARIRPSALPLAQDHTPARRSRLRVRTWTRIGAMLAVAALAAVLVTEWVDHGLMPRPTASTEVANPGQKRTFRLADGSTVALAGGSTMQASVGDNRRVVLRGEAFFDVAHDPQRPFVIDAGDVTVQVLGTAFNVRAVAGQPTVVAVERGRVAVTRGTNRVEITPGQEAVADLARAIEVQPSTHAPGAWRTGAFYADNATLATIAADVERRYGTTVTLEPGLEDRRWTLALPSAPSDTVVLDALAGPMGLTVTRTADGIRLAK